MPRLIPRDRSLLGSLVRAREALCKELATGQLASVETRRFYSDDPPPSAGSKPLFVLRDEEDRRYVLKVASYELSMAEEIVHGIRRLAQRPNVPARWATLDVEGSAVQGLVKPFIAFDDERELGADTGRWSRLQRAVILMEHAWEWFLDNMDANPGQYALLGPDAYPVNLDWDRAFSSGGHPELSRFAKYRHTLPNARTFLYADYVEGRVSLPFGLLLREAEWIQRLPEGEVRGLMGRLVDRSDPSQGREVVRLALERKRQILPAFRMFVQALQSERRGLRGEGHGLRRLAARVWKEWQIAVMRTVEGPLGRFGRGILKRTRSWGHQLPRPHP